MSEIRYVTSDEAADASALLERVVTKATVYNEIARADQLQKYTPAYMEKLIKGDPMSVAGSYRDGKLVGIVVTVNQTGPIWIDWICIDEHARGQHVGEDLIAFCLAEAPKRGSNKYWCDTRTENQPAVNLFTKMGFQKKCELKSHWYGQDFFIWERFI